MAQIFRLLAAVMALLFASPVIAQEAFNPGNPGHWLSAASTNATLVKAGAGTVQVVVAVNTTVTLYYLKFYDKATAPTCGTDTPVQTYPVPFGSSNAGGGLVVPVNAGISFHNGIGFCLTAGIADNDSGNAATGVAINIVWR